MFGGFLLIFIKYCENFIGERKVYLSVKIEQKTMLKVRM